MGKPLVRPRQGQFIKASNLSNSTTTSTVVVGGDTAFLEAEVASLSAQLTSAQASLTQAQAQVTTLTGQLAAAQAQAQADASTISGLQSQLSAAQSQVTALTAQVAALQAQVAALQAPNYVRVFIGPVVQVGGGIYIPPSYNDVTLTISTAPYKPKLFPVTLTGGGYP